MLSVKSCISTVELMGAGLFVSTLSGHFCLSCAIIFIIRFLPTVVMDTPFRDTFLLSFCRIAEFQTK